MSPTSNHRIELAMVVTCTTEQMSLIKQQITSKAKGLLASPREQRLSAQQPARWHLSFTLDGDKNEDFQHDDVKNWLRNVDYERIEDFEARYF